MKHPDKIYAINFAGFFDLKDEPFYEGKSLLNVEDYPAAKEFADEVCRRWNCHARLTDRKEGFYWVKYNGKWTIAEFWKVKDASGWDLLGEANLHIVDSNFDKIDEHIIERIEFQTHEQYHAYLRAHFAAMAMQGLVTKEGWSERFAEENSEKSLIKYIAYASVKMADELLKELEP